jgi:hypothetical protein
MAPLAAARAQAPARSESHIMGFLLVPWGADTASVMAAYGPPLMARATEDTGTVLIYKDAALGKPILSLFYLDKTKGLVRGVSSIPYTPAGTDCESVVRKSKESIIRIYPSLTPVEVRKQDDPAAPFCAAATAGKAEWSITWTDPASQNFIRIELQPLENRVEITYQSGSYQPQSAAK